MKSKHYDVIVAWAGGATVQLLDHKGVWTDMDGPGGDSTPGWFDDFKYRIKPETIRYLAVCQSEAGVYIEHSYDSAESAVRFVDDPVRAVLRIELDPETFDVISCVKEAP